MKLFSVTGFYDDGYSYSGIKQVWVLAEHSQEATEKVASFYNNQYDAIFRPSLTVEIQDKTLIFDSVANH